MKHGSLLDGFNAVRERAAQSIVAKPEVKPPETDAELDAKLTPEPDPEPAVEIIERDGLTIQVRRVLDAWVATVPGFGGNACLSREEAIEAVVARAKRDGISAEPDPEPAVDPTPREAAWNFFQQTDSPGLSVLASIEPARSTPRGDGGHIPTLDVLPTSGQKHDGGKLRWDLLPPEATEAVVKVLTHGAQKYGPENWRNVEEPRRRYYAAAMRHLNAWRQGFEADPDSGLPHLAHAICCLLFLVETP